MTEIVRPKSGFRQRLPLLIAVGVGALLWQSGLFGLMASERVVTWRFPVSYRDVRSYELQLWEGDELLAQQERQVPSGLTSEPEQKVTLSSGPHRAIARVTMANSAEPQVFQREFDPGSGGAVVIEMKNP